MAIKTKAAHDLLKATKVSEVEMVYKSKSSEKPRLTSSADIYKALLDVWGMGQIEYRESAKLVLLNSAMRCLGIITISEGGLRETSVDVRMVMQAALLANASVLCLAHNHPSGNTLPSADDDRLTERLKKACDVLGITLVDHIVVTGNAYYSYNDEGRL